MNENEKGMPPGYGPSPLRPLYEAIILRYLFDGLITQAMADVLLDDPPEMLSKDETETWRDRKPLL